MPRGVKLQIYVSTELAEKFLAECERQARSSSWMGEYILKQWLSQLNTSNPSQSNPIHIPDTPAPEPQVSNREQIGQIYAAWKSSFPSIPAPDIKQVQKLINTHGIKLVLAGIRDVASKENVQKPFGLLSYLLGRGEIAEPVSGVQFEDGKPVASEEILADYRSLRAREDKVQALFNRELEEILNES